MSKTHDSERGEQAQVTRRDVLVKAGAAAVAALVPLGAVLPAVRSRRTLTHTERVALALKRMWEEQQGGRVVVTRLPGGPGPSFGFVGKTGDLVACLKPAPGRDGTARELLRVIGAAMVSPCHAADVDRMTEAQLCEMVHAQDARGAGFLRAFEARLAEAGHGC